MRSWAIESTKAVADGCEPSAEAVAETIAVVADAQPAGAASTNFVTERRYAQRESAKFSRGHASARAPLAPDHNRFPVRRVYATASFRGFWAYRYRDSNPGVRRERAAS